jgi:hypothetical protein
MILMEASGGILPGKTLKRISVFLVMKGIENK